MQVTRTRRSIGSQIREALVELERRETILGWWIETDDSGVIRYAIVGNVRPRTPGEMIEWLNDRGFDIRFGRA